MEHVCQPLLALALALALAVTSSLGLGQDRVGDSREMARAEPKVTRLESGITHIQASSCNPKSQCPCAQTRRHPQQG